MINHRNQHSRLCSPSIVKKWACWRPRHKNKQETLRDLQGFRLTTGLLLQPCMSFPASTVVWCTSSAWKSVRVWIIDSGAELAYSNEQVWHGKELEFDDVVLWIRIRCRKLYPCRCDDRSTSMAQARTEMCLRMCKKVRKTQDIVHSESSKIAVQYLALHLHDSIRDELRRYYEPSCSGETKHWFRNDAISEFWDNSVKPVSW